MGIREQVSAVPAKPIIAAVCIFTLAAGAWHLQSKYRVCTHRASMTARFHDWAGQALEAGNKGLSLTAALPGEWDQVRISQGVVDEAPELACPFGWHWSEDERAALSDAGALTLIGFFADGRLVEMVDFDGRVAAFDIGSDALARAEAVFAPGIESGVLEPVARDRD